MATKNEQKQFERELTGKEVAISVAAMAVMVLLAGIDENKVWGMGEWLRVALGLALGAATCVWQYKRMHTSIDNDKSEEE